MFKIGRLVHTNDLSARKTVAAQSWCSRLSRERFSAMALRWHNLLCSLKAAIGYSKRTLGDPRQSAAPQGPQQGPRPYRPTGRRRTARAAAWPDSLDKTAARWPLPAGPGPDPHVSPNRHTAATNSARREVPKREGGPSPYGRDNVCA